MLLHSALTGTYDVQEKAWHPGFDVESITLEELLTALDAARAALPRLESQQSPPLPDVDVNAAAAATAGAPASCQQSCMPKRMRREQSSSKSVQGAQRT